MAANSPYAPTKQDHYVTNILKYERRQHYKADLALAVHLTLQITILLGATSIPFILNIPNINKIVPTVISAAIALAVAVTSFAKLGERASSLYRVSLDIRNEFEKFEYKLKNYQSLTDEEAFTMFAENVGKIRDDYTMQAITSNIFKEVRQHLGEK
jgi:hypothetical protein